MSLSLHFQWTIQYPNHDFLEKDILYSFSTKKRWARLLQLLLSVPKEGVLSMHHTRIQLKAPHTMPTYRWEAWVGRAGGDCQAGMILPWLQHRKSLSSDCDSWKLYCSFFLRPEAQDQTNNSAWLLLSVGEKKYPKAISCVAFLILDSVSLRDSPIHKGFLWRYVHFTDMFPRRAKTPFQPRQINEAGSQILFLACSLRNVSSMNEGKAEFLV